MKKKNPTLKSLIESSRLDWVNSDITEGIFPPTPLRSSGYRLFHFNRDIPSEGVIAEMKKYGYEPATIYELLAWDGWNGKDMAAALGSVGEVVGVRYVPCLGRHDSERSLDLYGFDDVWHSDCRFLAVKLSSETGKSDIGNSDTLALVPLTPDQALEKAKAYIDGRFSRLIRALQGWDDELDRARDESYEREVKDAQLTK